MSINLFLTVLLLSLVSSNGDELDNEEVRDNQRQREVKVFVDVHKHPKTSFSCLDKKAGEYYADIETNCAVYYICLANQYNKLAPISFACPNGTIFNQANKVCTPHEQVSCELATRFYDAQRGYIDSKDKDPSLYSPSLDVNSKPWSNNIQPSPRRPQNVPADNRRPIDEPQPQPPARKPTQESRRPTLDIRRPSEEERRPQIDARRPAEEERRPSIDTRRPTEDVRRPPIDIRRPNEEIRRPQSERRPIESERPLLPPAPQPLPYKPANRFTPPNLQPQRFSQPLSLPDSRGSPQLVPQLQPLPNPAPASRPLFNVPPRRIPIRVFGSPPTSAPTTTTTTTTTTPAPLSSTTIAPPVEYVYDYVDYDANTGATLPPQSRRKRSTDDAIVRRKGTLPTIPSDYVTTPIPTTFKDTDFTCADKVAGIAYADIANDCKMLHICLPIGKGKLDDHRVYCKPGYGYNQKTGVCDLLTNFDCKRSQEYFVYDKFANHDLYRKNLMKLQFRKKSTPKPIE